MNHTPGPWVVTEDGFIRQAEGLPRFYIASMVDIPRSADGDANARLIAAAPEMLGALYGARAALRHREMRDDNPILANIIAAISKATGGQQ